jgi:hypothetical protein
MISLATVTARDSPVAVIPQSLTTTAAPCRANSSASARPMPLPAPVTTATFPLNRVLVPFGMRRPSS